MKPPNMVSAMARLSAAKPSRLRLELPGVREPPRVDNERNPPEAKGDDHDLDRYQSGTKGDDCHRSLGQDQCQQSTEQCKQAEADPDSQRKPTEAAVSGH